MITKIITKTYFTTLVEVAKNVKSIENVVNAKVISSGEDKGKYFVEVEINYE